MGLDSVGTEIYDIHEYFRRLTVGQRTPGFWGVTISENLIQIIMLYLNFSILRIK